MMKRLLLVEDDYGLAIVLADALAEDGYDVRSVTRGDAALREALGEPFDVICLDVTLPGRCGFDVCRDLRESGVRSPILMLTGLSELEDKVRGFDAGADDYLTKPFDVRELLARLRALLRRAESQSPPGLWEYRFDETYVQFFGGVVMRRGTRINLSAKELQLLRYLIQNKGNTVTRGELLSNVWGSPGSVTRTVDVHIASLRQKLEDNPHHPRHILTSRREGYRFQD